MVVDVFIEGLNEFQDAAEHASLQPVFREIPEEAFDHVEPRGAGRREVHMETRVPFQPTLDLGVFVRGVVVGDQMDLAVLRSRFVDQTQKLQPFLVPMPLLAEADDPARRRVHGREERRGAVAFVVVGHGLSPATLQRKTRLRAIEGLHLAFLVNTEHDRVFRWAQVKADDCLEFLGKQGVVADLEGRGAVGLESVGPPDAQNAGVTDPHVLRHAASAPVGGMGRLFESGQPDYFRYLVWGDQRQATGAGSVFL